MASQKADQAKFAQLRYFFGAIDVNEMPPAVNPIGVSSLFNALLDREQERATEVMSLVNWVVRYLGDFDEGETLLRVLEERHDLSDMLSGETVTDVLVPLMEKGDGSAWAAAVDIVQEAYSYPNLKNDLDAFVPEMLKNRHLSLGNYARLANIYYEHNDGVYPDMGKSLKLQMRKVDRAMASVAGRLRGQDYLDSDFLWMIHNIHTGPWGPLSPIVEDCGVRIVLAGEELDEYFALFVSVRDANHPKAFWQHEPRGENSRGLIGGNRGKNGMIRFDGDFFLPPMLPYVAENIVFTLAEIEGRCHDVHAQAAERAEYDLRKKIMEDYDLSLKMSPKFFEQDYSVLSSVLLISGPDDGPK